jgi:hypothetical protein
MRLRYRFAGGDVSRDIAVRSIEERSSAEGTAFFLRLANDGRLASLVELLNKPTPSPADYVSAAGAVAVDRRGGPAMARPKVARSVGSALVLAAAAGLFLFSAYASYGVVTFRGSLDPSSVELLRADHPGVFYPYASSGNGLLKPGELVGVIDGNGGRSFGIAASCSCYLGDFPVSAGSTLYKGAVIARLIRPDSAAEVVASVPAADRWQIAVGDSVQLDVAGQSFSGHIVSMETDRPVALAADNSRRRETSVSMRIAADEQINPALFGSEVTVRVPRVAALARKAWGFVETHLRMGLPIG